MISVGHRRVKGARREEGGRLEADWTTVMVADPGRQTIDETRAFYSLVTSCDKKEKVRLRVLRRWRAGEKEEGYREEGGGTAVE